MILPSNELLSAVFGTDIVESYEELGDINFTERRKGYFAEGAINIYELMHMMKEWACENGWSTHSAIYKNENCLCDCFKVPNKELHTEANTEPEAVTKACEAMLKNV